ncbi:solute carrier family 26 member 6 [Lingula anatina]|uniref:Solute carrier family 26 member 6 n=1 Tax=Lingula anatina TaxID=7574 RepID=A0A1S3I7G4_LINAN|nr:solute carrier family 26 member 6 [Lingula anatina]|eukprot:XP_013394220.1 solute carrier family 26 member 6 [Lingula anatina]
MDSSSKEKHPPPPTEGGEASSRQAIQSFPQQTTPGITEADDSTKFTPVRPVYLQHDFDKQHGYSKQSVTAASRIHQQCRKHCTCGSGCIQGFLLRLFPFVSIMRQYKFPQWFIGDLVSGLTVGIMHLPQGMAYALLAGLPSIHGLYVSFFPPLVYFFFGTSKHTSLGTMAVVCLMAGAVVDRQTVSWTPPISSLDILNVSSFANDTPVSGNITCDADTNSNQECVDFKIGVATALAMLVGFWQLMKGILRLGFITNYLSDPLISGFTTGAACHVFSSQIKHVFGLSIKASEVTNPFKLVKFYFQFFQSLPQTNLAALTTSVICILALALTKECINARFKSKMKMPVPIELIVVIVSTVVCYFAKLDEEFKVTVVGYIPTGIPEPTLPPVEHFSNLIMDAFGVSIVAFTISVSMAKILAQQQAYTIDATQELIAYGLSNVVGSVFSTFPCCVSMSRSLVQETTGGKTQVASLVSCLFIFIVILFAGSLFRTLPRCVLASIVIVALKGMFLQVKDLNRLWRISKFDFAIWTVTFLAVVLLNVDWGLIVGVGFSLVTVVFRTQWPRSSVLGRCPNSEIYVDTKTYKNTIQDPGIKIFRFESSLYYANAERFSHKLYSATGCDPGLLMTSQDRGEDKSAKEGEDDQTQRGLNQFNAYVRFYKKLWMTKNKRM